jgi:hypothetical protein
VSVILSDLIEAIGRLGTTADPIELATVQERDDLVSLLRSLEILLPLAQAALAWRTTMSDSPGSEVALADRDALLDALSKVHP